MRVHGRPDRARIPNINEVTFRGVCAGINGKYVRLENCKFDDPNKGDYKTRITEDYFPLDLKRAKPSTTC